MARYKTGNSIRDRKNRECDGYRNIDTAQACIVLRNDRKCHDFVKKNADTLLTMKKKDKLKLIERHSEYGFGGASYENIDYRELNTEIRNIRGKR